MTTLYVGARLENGKLVLAKAGDEVNVALDNYEKLAKDIAGKFHLYALSPCGGYLILEAGDFHVGLEGPEELNLPRELAGALRVLRYGPDQETAREAAAHSGERDSDMIPYGMGPDDFYDDGEE